jgi:multiple sugar transport system permease protein
MLDAVRSKDSTLARSGERRWRRATALDESNPLVPYAFLLPHALLFFAFMVYPLVFGFWISVVRYDPLQDTQPFVGLANYARLLDPSMPQFQRFWGALGNTLLFVALAGPLLIAVALGLALQLHQPIFGRTFFRSVFFMPGILSVSVISILWRWIFNERNGLVNVALNGIGVPQVSFLTTAGLVWTPIVVATVWWTVGFNMTIYLAGLSAIPESYYEAAQLDGAGPWARFRHITLPLLAPTTLFVLVTTMLATFQLFGQSLLITNGGPERSTQSSIMYITQEAFTNNQLSSATSMSFVFGLLMMIVAVIQFRGATGGMERP